MKCIKHTERGAAARCCVCGKPFCCECLTDYHGRIYCREDAGTAKKGRKPYRYKSRVTALILCSAGFFGIAGLHRIYTGKTASGILYLFTCGLLFLGTIADIAAILKRSFNDGRDMPLL